MPKVDDKTIKYIREAYKYRADVKWVEYLTTHLGVCRGTIYKYMKKNPYEKKK